MDLQRISLVRNQGSRLLYSAVVLAVVAAQPQRVQAESPQVHFDLPYVVAARDVSSAEFQAVYTQEKLIEVRLQVSSLLTSGSEDDLRQYLYSIVSPQRTMTVVDYLPKTLHETSLAGNMTVESSDEKTASIGISVSGQYESSPEAGFTSGVGEKKTSSVKYERLPPLESVTASGTVLRGSGVYFKLKASDRNLLEGAREVAMTLRVPKAWRADFLHVRCEADGFARGVVRSLDTLVSCGERDFLVAVFMEGDFEARATAEETARRESALRRLAQSSAVKSAQRSAPSFTKLLSLPTASKKPLTPDQWLPSLLFSEQIRPVSPKLPRDVREAAIAYQAARIELARLSGWSGSNLAAATIPAGVSNRH